MDTSDKRRFLILSSSGLYLILFFGGLRSSVESTSGVGLALAIFSTFLYALGGEDFVSFSSSLSLDLALTAGFEISLSSERALSGFLTGLPSSPSLYDRCLGFRVGARTSSSLSSEEDSSLTTRFRRLTSVPDLSRLDFCGAETDSDFFSWTRFTSGLGECDRSRRGEDLRFIRAAGFGASFLTLLGLL